MSVEYISAENFCTSVRDGTHDTPKRTEAGYKLVTGKHLKNGQINPEEAYYISPEDYDSINLRSRVEQWDVLMSMIGTVGEVAVVKDTPSYAIKNIALFKCGGSETKGRWLAYYLQSPEAKGKMQGSQKGASQQFLSLKQLRNLPIPNCDEASMRSVVGVLSAYDDLIENNQKQIKLLEEAAQRLYQEWFVDLHFPGYEHTPIVDGVPEGWKRKPINSFVTLLSGFAFKSNTFDSNGKFKLVTIKNVQDGSFDGSRVNRILEIPAKMPEYCRLSEGDILLSLTGNVGRVCVVYGSNYLLNQRVAKLKSSYRSYTYCLFRSRDMFDCLNNLANGAAQQNLSPVRTGEVLIILPSCNLLQTFELLCKPIFEKMLLLQNSIQQLTEARDRLLPKLMSGEIIQ